MTQPGAENVMQDHWVYQCYDSADRLLYVGVTSCGLRRFAYGHSRQSAWWSDVAHIEIEHLPTREAALAREEALILESNPLHNVVYAESVAYRIPDEPAPTRWLSMEDLADWLSASPDWLEIKLQKGMPHALIGGNLRFKADEVRAWLRG